MKQEIWVCLVRYSDFSLLDNVSSDGYTTLNKAKTALELRLGRSGCWVNEFMYTTSSAVYELKCVSVEA
jgi:hypothetical protein